MRKVLSLAALLMLSTATNATIINFDDIASSNQQQIPPDYAGLMWDSNWYIQPNEQAPLSAVSGNYAAFNGYGALELNVSSSSDFDFTGAYFSSWSVNGSFVGHSATRIVVEGYNDAALVGSVVMDLSAVSYEWLQADLIGVDELRFISSAAGQWWLMDNLTINESVSVSEPSGLMFVGLGIAALGVTRRRSILLKNSRS